MSNVEFVISQKDNPDAQRALSAIAHALYDRNDVCIVRYVPRMKSSPHLGFLEPSKFWMHLCVTKLLLMPFISLLAELGSRFEGLYLHQLPFVEDVRYSWLLCVPFMCGC